MAVATLVNDLHSRLNATRVAELVSARSPEDIAGAVKQAARARRSVSICAGRHAMGAQQFATDSTLIDMSAMTGVLEFDREAGLVRVASGTQWPELIDFLCASGTQWTIAQKQTGCDKLSIGGAVSANVHGRGLRMKPFISDVASFRLVTADGAIKNCSREENANLFALAAGGYGLFGVIVDATIKLTPRTNLKRVVEIVDVTEVIAKLEQRIDDGFLYGDFQFSIDDQSEDFLRRGVLSTYLPVSEPAPAKATGHSLSVDQWKELLYLAHCDKARAFDVYAGHYMRTNGQIYSSDRFQLATYIDGYHDTLDARLGCSTPASEIITEIYVPRAKLAEFMLAAGTHLRANEANVIYGTVRLIERDDESFLAWARESFACIIFNLHTEHTEAGQQRSAAAFRALISLALEYGGSYYLTYHKYASIQQLRACHPQFDHFIALKEEHDPDELFSSNWYRHYKALAQP